MSLEMRTVRHGMSNIGKNARHSTLLSTSFEAFDGNICLEISQSKLGKGLIFMNIINLKTGQIMQKTRDVDFLIKRLWSKPLLRRIGWL